MYYYISEVWYSSLKKSLGFFLLQDPPVYFHNENPLELTGAAVSVASNYTKKPHVFRLKLANGGEYLFQAKDDVSPL